MNRAQIVRLLCFVAAVVAMSSIAETPRPSQANQPPIVTQSAIPGQPQTQSVQISNDETVALVHLVISKTEEHLTWIHVSVAILAVLLGLAGISSLVNSWRYGRELNSLKKSNEELKKEKEIIENEIRDLQQSKGEILRSIEDFRRQEKEFRKWTSTIQAVTVVRSGLGNSARLTALQQLSQKVDPFGIPAMLEVLRHASVGHLNLRKEAAYGLGFYANNQDFKQYYREILSGFRDVLENTKTLPSLALKVIESARRFGSDASELEPLFERWLPRDEPQSNGVPTE
jgi:cell division protein FtsB